MRSSPPNASRFGDPQLTDGVYLTLSAVMALVTAPSIALNATVIAVTLRHKQLRLPLNYALVNMAVADLGAALTGGVLGVVYNARPGHPPMGRTACVVEGFAVSVFGEAGEGVKGWRDGGGGRGSCMDRFWVMCVCVCIVFMYLLLLCFLP